MKVIFVNQKPYDIHLSTPSGAGRILPTGYACEGDYYLSCWRNGVPLTKLTEDQAKSFDRSLILVSISLGDKDVQNELTEPKEAKEYHQNEAKVTEQLETHKTLEGSLNQAMKEMGTQLPTVAELEKMSAAQLSDLATRHNISGVGTRKDLIAQIKTKFGL